MLAALCFTVWCLFGTPEANGIYPPPFALTLAHDAISKGSYEERAFFLEQYNTFAGLVQQRYTITPVAGYFPFRLGVGPIRLDGGASVASGPFPEGGTKANWTARLRIKIAGPLHLDYWHFSNARSAIPDPSVNMIGVTFRWTPGTPKGGGWGPCRGDNCPKPPTHVGVM